MTRQPSIGPVRLQKKVGGRNKNRLTEGLNFLIASPQVYRDGVLRTWPRLYLLFKDADGVIDAVPVVSVDEYFDDNSARSYEWMKQTVSALGLLVDHTIATIPFLTERVLNASDGIRERHLLRTFAHDLRDGTISNAANGGLDRLGLYWRPKGHDRAHVLLKRLTQFFKSLGETDYGSRWGWAANPVRPANPMSTIRMIFELAVRKATSLLSHLDIETKEPPHRFGGIVEPRSKMSAAPNSFPAKWIIPFLTKGFTNNEGRTDETAQLLAYELFLTGQRRSEPFHHYVTDVQFVDDTYEIFMHHPEWGKIQAGGVGMNRRQYLAQPRFNRSPRNRGAGMHRAGFKGALDDDKGTPLFWLPLPAIKSEFDRLLRKYMQVTRPALMLRRPSHLKDHPFLYVSSGLSAESGGGEIGEPYTISAFLSAWKAAIARTSRRNNAPDFTHSKRLGTTPHGFRHNYGRYLVTLGVDLETIRQCMHHKSVESTRVYTRLTPREINQILKERSSAWARRSAA
ncbi:site-specific integrase [Rhizobium sp. L245/93]|uniref:site-specific integrase n=1 Tax=Rhizobium sp. L245/93 TaxID=2819998 RepID=UPI001ADB3ED1|nr:site-specific integrase [Rhizobium sp. L245/93]MBO9170043.1 site-specific integrase [Rhizobium sp. L245/93]